MGQVVESNDDENNPLKSNRPVPENPFLHPSIHPMILHFLLRLVKLVFPTLSKFLGQEGKKHRSGNERNRILSPESGVCSRRGGKKFGPRNECDDDDGPGRRTRPRTFTPSPPPSHHRPKADAGGRARIERSGTAHRRTASLLLANYFYPWNRIIGRGD